MLLSIQHRTELAYTARISESVMELRMAPRTETHQTLRGFSIALGPTAAVFEHHDWLGNRVHSFSVTDFHDRVVIFSHSAVATHPKHPRLDSLADELPLEITEHWLNDFLRFQGPIGEDERLVSWAEDLGLADERRVGPLLDRLSKALLERLGYEKGVTNASTTVSDVLGHEKGVCQDFAHLGIALLRHRGVPARYVSGYLFRPKASEVETHAWLEAYVPSVGWVGVDPTHAMLASEGHVATAVGRNYADVPPNRGVFRGDARETMKVNVQISEVAEVPSGLLSPRPIHIEVPTFPEGRAEHREQINYQQEQQQQQ